MPETTDLTEVKSSNVAAVGFADGVLTVKYKNNRTYSYHGVPEELYQELLKADSIGSFLAANVKGQFSTKPEEKTDEPKPETTDQDANDPQDAEPESVPADDSIEENTDSSPDDGETEAPTDEQQSSTGEPDQPETSEGLSDEGDTDAGSSSDEGSEAQSVEETPETDAEGGDQSPEQSGTPEPEADAVDGDDADSAGDAETAGENSDDAGSDETSPEEGNEGSDLEASISAKWSVILKHFGGDVYHQSGERDGGVVIFAVKKGDDLMAEGSFLDLYETAILGKGADEMNKEPLDQTPTQEESENLELLRSEIGEFDIDLQYERAEAKDGSRHWNLTTSVEKGNRTLHHTSRINENCTKDEVEEAIKEIVAVFVKAV